MPPSTFNESAVEEAALNWLRGLGYSVVLGPTIAPGEPGAERESFDEVVLAGRLRAALARLNPGVTADALDEAFRRVVRVEAADAVGRNRVFHRMLVEGVSVEQKRADGSIGGVIVRLVDFDNPDGNDWLAVNQFTVTSGGPGGGHNRRPDVVIFVNGLPLAVIELKNAADKHATIWSAFNQLQTYKAQVPRLFAYNEAMIISDGMEARVGSLTADRERFMPWRTTEGETLASRSLTELDVLLTGVFEKQRFLRYLRHAIVFEDEGAGKVIKKMAGYHQFHAVNRAIEATVRASAAQGDRRAGVVWHTQGSGKSLTMAFYAGEVIAHPAMENPTIVVLTDRNDLDNQLYGVFGRCQELLRQPPEQAMDRADLRARLMRASGGVVFTTIQKFMPEEKGDKHAVLSDRRNIVVIADEAHRSQYDFIDGFARHMRDALPKASFIGFTGTPIEKTDANTQAVFGDYVSVYDIQQAVEDGATVPIYYESRLAKLALRPEEKPTLDEDFEEATEGEELDQKEKLKTKWAQLEVVVGSEHRIKLIASDLVEHWERRLEDGMDGKAMVVAMSRRICVDLYNAIVALRPQWHHADDDKGVIKVVMTGSASDSLDWQGHIRNKPKREALAKAFKDPKHPFKIVIVRDMWLTGFDAPCLHTMYVDKPMRGHGLMQAIARVNRVFRDKPGGLIVDYLGLAHELKQALSVYTESGGKGKTAIDQEEAVAVMLEKHEVLCEMFAGFDRAHWTTGRPEQRLSLLPAAQEHVLAQQDGKDKFLLAVKELSAAFALAVPHDEAMRIRDDVGFFQAVRAAMLKSSGDRGRTEEDIEHAIRQLVSRAVASEEVVDIFAAAGLKKPDISILSEEFLAEVRGMPHKNLAVELLRKLLSGEIKTRSKKNIVQARSFADLLEQAIKKYQNRAIEAAAVIEELIGLAKEMREADRRGEALGLNEDEVAFYDALEVNDSAVKVLGEPTLQKIARELVESVRANTSIDWTVKESVRAKLRVIVKRILRKYGYPPDKQEQATQTVLEQAELLCGAVG
ncbi:MAG: type I restriction endonuclease subunit R [Phycisphaeraceae bacterium]|nr:type I restriction endonuclease subunit R [Phycisphaeraceae bacterium]